MKRLKSGEIRSVTLILVLILTLALSGCASLVPNKSPDSSETPPDAEKVIIEASGSYVGQIDNNSIEITVDGKEQAFRLTGELLDEFAALGLQMGQAVEIKYYENEHGQLILEELYATENPEVPGVEELTASGVYVGKIDSNSIEIAVGGVPQPFWVAEELKSDPSFESLPENQNIEFQYYLDEHGRSVITSFELR